MEGLLSCANAIARLGVSSAVAAARRFSIMTLYGAFAAVAAVGMTGCLVAALWIFVLPSFGPAGAALAAAGALGLLSLVLIALALLVARGHRGASRSLRRSDSAVIEAMGLLKEHKGAVLLAAVVAGLAAGHAHRDRNSDHRPAP
jgi:hypothetical protein